MSQGQLARGQSHQRKKSKPYLKLFMANFGHITKPSNPEAVRGGYKNELLVVDKSDVTTWAKPTNAPAAIGDLYTIATAHTFPVNKGYFSWALKLKSATVKGATVGEDGAKQVQYTAEGMILGDSASTQEQMHRALNSDLVFFLKDSNCLVNDSYLQFGDECDSPVVDVEFDSQNSDGTKNWKITLKITSKRFFYNATLVKAA
jgi:hypothetical protein